MGKSVAEHLKTRRDSERSRWQERGEKAQRENFMFRAWGIEQRNRSRR